MRTTVTTTYLELDDARHLRPPGEPAPPGFRTRVVQDPGINADLYRRVGADYAWIDRLRWTAEQWSRWVARIQTHVFEIDGEVCGYFELDLDSPDSAKISLFGLLPEFHGRGLGGHALTAALSRALELRPRVWLTTCTLDSPQALPNYEARGMRQFRTETFQTRI